MKTAEQDQQEMCMYYFVQLAGGIVEGSGDECRAALARGENRRKQAGRLRMADTAARRDKARLSCFQSS